tara:strand:- start:5045 stop:5686 length:642 start_codon:yes stop_codon:yes gene_type:complete
MRDEDMGALAGFGYLIMCSAIFAFFFCVYMAGKGNNLNNYIAMDMSGEIIDCDDLLKNKSFNFNGELVTVTELERSNVHNFSQCREGLDKKHASRCEHTVMSIFSRGYVTDLDEKSMTANKKYCEKQFSPYLDKRIVYNHLDAFASDSLLEVKHRGEYYNINGIIKVKKAEEVFIKGLYRVVIYFEEAATSMYFDDTEEAGKFIEALNEKLTG